MKIEIELDYEPYEWQRKVHEAFENKRFLVLACGQRTGRSNFLIMEGIQNFIKLLNKGRNIYQPEIKPSVKWLLLAPNKHIAQQSWSRIRKAFPQIMVCDISDPTMTIKTVGNGIIKARNCCDLKFSESKDVDLVTITEASRIKDLEMLWWNIEKRLSERAGKAIIDGTYPSKYFNKMWGFGQYLSDWASFKISTFDNPEMKEYYSEKINKDDGTFITRAEDLERLWGKKRFRQEFMGEFVTDEET